MQTDTIKMPETPILSGQKIRDTSMSKARLHADRYIRKAIGPQYTVYSGVAVDAVWRFLIQCKSPQAERPVIVGSIDVKVDPNAQAESEKNLVVPLNENAIQKIHERSEILISDLCGTLPVDEKGYVIAQLAARNVKAYLAQKISLFAQPVGEPIWLAAPSPHWQVSTCLQLPNTTTVSLATISVNAQTGDVIPLTDEQLLKIQKQITDATPHPSQSATAAV